MQDNYTAEIEQMMYNGFFLPDVLLWLVTHDADSFSSLMTAIEHKIEDDDTRQVVRTLVHDRMLISGSYELDELQGFFDAQKQIKQTVDQHVELQEQVMSLHMMKVLNE